MQPAHKACSQAGRAFRTLPQSLAPGLDSPVGILPHVWSLAFSPMKGQVAFWH